MGVGEAMLVAGAEEQEIYSPRQSMLCLGGSPGFRAATRTDSCGEVRPK